MKADPAGGSPADGGEDLLAKECLQLLRRLCDGLLSLQIAEEGQPGYGAIADPACGRLHTRGAEAVYPLAVAWKHGGSERDREAALILGDWLIGQQTPDGSWLETPGNWQGTTADQALALSLALPILRPGMGVRRERAWMDSISRAAGFLVGFISEQNAHINYCATGAAALAAASGLTGSAAQAERSRELAHLVAMEKMDAEGFIFGEGKRKDGVLHGVDIGYNMDMTIWSLALYARLMGDEEVERIAAKSLAAHLPFVYPDGSIDNSWGVRSNKWTVYGSKTAHGAQASFALLSRHDPRFRSAALRTLGFLKGMVLDGLVGYGPQWWEREDSACIYPTFARASNLAIAVEFGAAGREPGGGTALLPCDAPFARHFPTVDVAVVRTGGLMATVTAYRYTARGDRSNSKYMSRPGGGCVSNLWFDGYGWLQAASQTRYERWEKAHFPEVRGGVELLPLGPRIELVAGSRAFSSLNEFAGRLQLREGRDPLVTTRGVLRDAKGKSGRVSYSWTHVFETAAVRKEVRVTGWRLSGRVRIVEPVIETAGTRIEKTGPGTLRIVTPRGTFRLSIDEGRAELSFGGDGDRYWWPFPAMQGLPIVLDLGRVVPGRTRTVRYSFERME